MTNEEIIELLACEACISLFSDYSLELRRVETVSWATDTELLFCVVVGFTGDQIRGSILLATTREPLGRTAPVNDTSFREWIAELANQLLGRIKNKLVRRGVVLHVSTPVVLRGVHLTPLTRTDLKPIVFDCDDGCVCVWLDAELVKGVDLTVIHEDAGVIVEGDGLLF
jgi:CheY-specific phosphatase CheX